jgi:broad specificity phosphatase PhoE
MLKHWENQYNSAPIIQNTPLNEALLTAFNEADIIISSTLKRTKDSITILGHSVDISDAVFNEAQIPDLDGSFLKLRPSSWLVLFRLLSLAGVGRWAKTLKDTKDQAKDASRLLLKLSEDHDNIILMGHGVMNWLIRKELLKLDWQKEGKDEHRNWGMTVLSRV